MIKEYCVGQNLHSSKIDRSRQPKGKEDNEIVYLIVLLPRNDPRQWFDKAEYGQVIFCVNPTYSL
jgi:hypothetical protein